MTRLLLLLFTAVLLSGCMRGDVFDLMERGRTGHIPAPPELSNCEVLGRDGVWRSCTVMTK